MQSKPNEKSGKTTMKEMGMNLSINHPSFGKAPGIFGR